MPCLFCLVLVVQVSVDPLGTWVPHGVPWCALLRPTLATQPLQGNHSRSGFCFLDLPPLLKFLIFFCFPFSLYRLNISLFDPTIFISPTLLIPKFILKHHLGAFVLLW